MAKSGKERQAAYRERKMGQGGKSVSFVLDPEAAEALDAIRERTGQTQSEIVCAALKSMRLELEKK